MQCVPYKAGHHHVFPSFWVRGERESTSAGGKIGKRRKGPSSSFFLSFLSSAEDAVQQSPHKSLRWEFRRTASKAIGAPILSLLSFIFFFFLSSFSLFLYTAHDLLLTPALVKSKQNGNLFFHKIQCAHVAIYLIPLSRVTNSLIEATAAATFYFLSRRRRIKKGHKKWFRGCCIKWTQSSTASRPSRQPSHQQPSRFGRP